MFAYYFQLGLRSLRRNPALTALMVMAIGFGVAASGLSSFNLVKVRVATRFGKNRVRLSNQSR